MSKRIETETWIVTLDGHNKAMSQLSPWAQGVVEGLISRRSASIAGVDVVVFNLYWDFEWDAYSNEYATNKNSNLLTDADKDTFNFDISDDKDSTFTNVFRAYTKLIPAGQKIMSGSEW